MRSRTLAFVAFATLLAAPMSAQSYFATGDQYDTLRLDFNACGSGGTYPPAGLNEITASPDNPFLDYRLDVTLTSPSSVVHTRPGFYAADGNGGDSGCTWSVRFTPDENGDWSFTAKLYRGTDANVLSGSGTLLKTWSGLLDVDPVPSSGVDVFRKHGPLTPDSTYPYMVHDDGDYFLKHGMNSPENFLAYAGFDYTRDYGGLTVKGSTYYTHNFTAHLSDWQSGDPNWTATVLPAAGLAPLTFPVIDPNAGKKIIGAIRYLAENNCNSLYFLPLNLGGDGEDTHPFVKDSVVGYGSPPLATSTATHYDVGRMRQWSYALEFAQDLGVFLDLVLFEQELGNMQMLADSVAAGSVGDLTIKRKLYLKQMMAYFGHLPGIRFILCEENGFDSMDEMDADREFSAVELDAMAAFLEGLQSWNTMVSVHEDNNTETPFSELLSWNGGSALPAWCDSLSLQIGYSTGPTDWTNMGRYFEFMKWKYGGVAHFDEIGDDQYAVSGNRIDIIRLHYTWDVLLSGGQIAWYCGYHPSAYGGDLGLEDFTQLKSDYFDTAWKAVDILNDFSFWKGVDMDTVTNEGSVSWNGVAAGANVRTSIISGSAATAAGEPEVMRIPGEAFIVYYETVDDSGFTPGSIDLTSEPTGTAWNAQWYDAESWATLGSPFTVAAGTVVNLATGTNALSAMTGAQGPDVVLVIKP